MNPHPPYDAPQPVNIKPTTSSSLKIHRETLSLAPALVERLAKNMKTIATGERQKKDAGTNRV
jgi:hypothetical protein